MPIQKYTSAIISDRYGRFLLTSEYAKIGICTPKMALSVEIFIYNWESSLISVKNKIQRQLGIMDNIKFDSSVAFTNFGKVCAKAIEIYLFKIPKKIEFKISNFDDNPILFKSLPEIKSLANRNIIELSTCAKEALKFLEN